MTATPVNPVVGTLLGAPVGAILGGSGLELVGNGLQGLLGVLFVVIGTTKLIGVDQQVESFERWGYPQWFRILTGGVESTGGLVLAAGLFVPTLTLVGGALIGATMLGAVYTHVIRVDDPMSETAKPTTLLVLVALAVVLP